MNEMKTKTTTNSAPATPGKVQTKWRGDRAEYTGKCSTIHGCTAWQIIMLEGVYAGKCKTTFAPPGAFNAQDALRAANGGAR